MESGDSGMTLVVKDSAVFRLDVNIDVTRAFVSIMLVEPIVAGMFARLNWDTIDRQRRKVIKNAATWPSGRQAQKYVADMVKGYSAKSRKYKRKPVTLAEASGEVFARGSWSEGTENYMRILEVGGRVVASDWMAIPIHAMRLGGMSRVTAIRAFRKKLAAGVYDYTKSGYLIERLKDRTILAGVLRKSREQPAMLSFQKCFSLIWPKQAVKYNKTLDLLSVSITRAEKYTKAIEARNRVRDHKQTGAMLQRVQRLDANIARLASDIGDQAAKRLT